MRAAHSRLVGIVLIGLLATAATALAAGGPARPCVVHRCRLLATTDRITVYRETNRHPARELPYLRTRVRWRPTGHTTWLGDSVFGASLGRFAVSGRVVGYTLFSLLGNSPDSGTDWQIVRLNATTGHREETQIEGGTCTGELPYGAPGVTDLRVTARGSVAWVIRGQFDPGNAGNLDNARVCVLRSGSVTPVLLASSKTIASGSLAIEGDRLRWTEDNLQRSAVIG